MISYPSFFHLSLHFLQTGLRGFCFNTSSSSPNGSTEIWAEGISNTQGDSQLLWVFQMVWFDVKSVGRHEFISHSCDMFYLYFFFFCSVSRCLSRRPTELSSSGMAVGKAKIFIFNLFVSLLNKHLFGSCYMLGEELSAMFTNINKKWLLLARRGSSGLVISALG